MFRVNVRDFNARLRMDDRVTKYQTQPKGKAERMFKVKCNAHLLMDDPVGDYLVFC